MDTRCANTAYQLDVDEMILEYLLHNTLKAHIEGHDPSKILTGGNEDAAMRKATSLLEILNNEALTEYPIAANIHLFKANHPHCDFSANLDFKLKLLELLLLFGHGRGSPSILSSSSIEWAHRRGIINHVHRRESWCAYLSAFPKDPDVAKERELLDRWQGHKFQKSSPDAVNGPESKIPLIYLLPRFLELSYDLSQSMINQDVNDMWLDMATDFMTQAAIEYSADHDVPGDDALMGAFSWGLGVPAKTGTTEEKNTNRDRNGNSHIEASVITEKVDSMMRPEDADPAVTPPWVKWRREALLRFWPEDATKKSCEEVLENLSKQYPLAAFEVKLMMFINGSYEMERLEPVLLQIEQGGLDGLSEDEFRDFMERVGDDSPPYP